MNRVQWLFRKGTRGGGEIQPAGGAAVDMVDVYRRYETGQVEALRGITMHIDAGEFVTICGPSGSGKSTLLHLLASLDLPTTGRVLVDGVDTSALRGSALAAFRRERVGLVFQGFHLLPALTVLENVMAPLLPYCSLRTLRERARLLLARVGMEQRANHVPGELSGGEQQRVAIARALIASPRLLLADEPTASLDSATGFTVMELLHELQYTCSMTLVVVTHDPRVAALAPRTIRIEDGVIAQPASTVAL